MEDDSCTTSFIAELSDWATAVVSDSTFGGSAIDIARLSTGVEIDSAIRSEGVAMFFTESTD